MQQVNTIGRDYTLPQLIKFAAPAIFTDFALSLLRSLDDGLFITRYVGPNAMAAFSIFMSMMMILDSFSALLGGCATLCASKMGAGRGKEAAGDFTTVAIVTACFGIVVAFAGHLFLEPLLRFFGASDTLMPYCYDFANIALWYYPINLMGMLFSRFYVTAGKPKYSMYTMLGNAFCNIFFDWLFVARMGKGMVGVAYANLVGSTLCFLFGFIFYSSKSAEIGFAKPSRNPLKLIARVARVGFPPMISTLTLGISSTISNHVLMGVGGEAAISSYSIVNNIQFMFMSAFFGLYGAVGPLASYAFGEKNGKKLGRVLKQAIALTGLLALLIIALYLVGKNPVTALYVGSGEENTEMRAMIQDGLTVAPCGFIFFGFVVLAEHLFGAIHNTRAAAAVTAAESLIFSNISMLTLPRIFGIWGAWWHFTAHQFCAFLVALYYFRKHRNDYGYGKSGRADALEKPQGTITES